MHESESNRVVVRQGARELSRQEVESVSGASAGPIVTVTLNPFTGSSDFDQLGG